MNDIVPSPTTEEQIRDRLHHISLWELEFCPNIPWTSVEELLNSSVRPKQSSELNQPQWMVTMAYGQAPQPQAPCFTLNTKIMDLILPQRIESNGREWKPLIFKQLAKFTVNKFVQGTSGFRPKVHPTNLASPDLSVSLFLFWRGGE